MYKASSIFSVISGVIILIFGALSFITAFNAYAFFTDAAAFIYPLCGVFLTASGICGIAGGLLLWRRTRTGRALLLAAGILSLSFFLTILTFTGLVFFVVFMTARSRAVPQWPEEAPDEALAEATEHPPARS